MHNSVHQTFPTYLNHGMRLGYYRARGAGSQGPGCKLTIWYQLLVDTAQGFQLISVDEITKVVNIPRKINQSITNDPTHLEKCVRFLSISIILGFSFPDASSILERLLAFDALVEPVCPWVLAPPDLRFWLEALLPLARNIETLFMIIVPFWGGVWAFLDGLRVASRDFAFISIAFISWEVCMQ